MTLENKSQLLLVENRGDLNEYSKNLSIRERIVRSKTLNYVLKFAIYFLIVQGLFSSGYILFRPVRKSLSDNDDTCNCGNSIAEALSKGCKYSQMAPAWLPPACTDEELDRKFEDRGNGPNGTWR
jgi:hypothetical protein